MITRRNFLETSLAGTLGAGVILAASRSMSIAGAPGPQRSALHTAVVDLRFAESRRFGAALDRLGTSVRTFEADVTELWFTQLDPMWRAERGPVAGLTAYGVLFCLERLAWDHGMRMVYCAEHEPLAEGGMQHTLPASASALAAELQMGGHLAWPRTVAQWLAQTRLTATQAATALTDIRLRTSERMRGSRAAATLYSWVIA